MGDKYAKLSLFLLLFILGAARPWRSGWADSSDDYDENGNKKTYYWQGNQINNLSRLGTGPDFEGEQHRNKDGKDSDHYLATIRANIAHKAQMDAKEKTALTFQNQLPGSPIELTALSPGLRITLHAEALFDENTATMKVGSVDTLERLRTLLETERQKPLQFVIADTMDDMPGARNIDAERTLVLMGMLEMSSKKADQENLTPETLTQ